MQILGGWAADVPLQGQGLHILFKERGNVGAESRMRGPEPQRKLVSPGLGTYQPTYFPARARRPWHSERAYMGSFLSLELECSDHSALGFSCLLDVGLEVLFAC